MGCLIGLLISFVFALFFIGPQFVAFKEIKKQLTSEENKKQWRDIPKKNLTIILVGVILAVIIVIVGRIIIKRMGW